MSTNNVSRTISDNIPESTVNPKTNTDNPTITRQELLQLKDECLAKIRQEELYRIRNDAKLRAACTTESYDEFKDIVDAAHLKPVNKKDKMDASTRSRLWNPAAKECSSE